jgi:hypothetical protein
MKDFALGFIIVGAVLASIATGLGAAASGMPASRIAAEAVAELAQLHPGSVRIASTKPTIVR